MALNWELSKIANWQKVCKFCATAEDEKNNLSFMRPETEQMIWMMMGIEISSITEKNVDEIWWRLQFLRSYDHFESFCKSEKNELPVSPLEFTKEDIIKHIGLMTNVGTKTRTQFLKTKVDRFIRETTEIAKSNYHPKIYGLDEIALYISERDKQIKAWEKWKIGESIKEDQNV